MLGRSFWVLQALLLPIRLLLVIGAVGGLAIALYGAALLWNALLTPWGPLVFILLIGLIALGITFASAILAGVVWAFFGLIALRNGDASRLTTLRRAEFSLAIVLTMLFIILLSDNGFTYWTRIVAAFAAAQWAAWALLNRWKAPADQPSGWIALEDKSP